MSTSYHVYGGDSAGGPIDYGTPLATTAGLSWATSPLPASSRNRLGVRAFDTVSTLEERNTDAVVEIDLDAAFLDISGVPLPPLGLTARPTASGGVRVTWTYPAAPSARTPTGFHVYLGTPTPDYVTPAATVAYTAPGIYRADLTGLADGTAYQVAVRAYNATGEEQNTLVADVTGDGTAPDHVDGLTAT